MKRINKETVLDEYKIVLFDIKLLFKDILWEKNIHIYYTWKTIRL